MLAKQCARPPRVPSVCTVIASHPPHCGRHLTLVLPSVSAPVELYIGYVLGFRTGYLIVFCGKCIGSGTAYLLARGLCHGWATRKYGSHDLLLAIQRACLAQPIRITVIVRLMYIPIVLKNVGLALIPVGPKLFFSTLLSVELFNSSLLVGLGSGAQSLQAALSGKSSSPAQLASVVLGLALLPLMFVYGVYLTRTELAQLRANKGEPAGGGDEDVECHYVPLKDADRAAEVAGGTETVCAESSDTPPAQKRLLEQK